VTRTEKWTGLLIGMGGRVRVSEKQEIEAMSNIFTLGDSLGQTKGSVDPEGGTAVTYLREARTIME